MSDPSPLDNAVAFLEAQRLALGDAAVDAAIAALRSHAPAASVRAAQRLRQVSVLFVDVADSTALLQSVNTEDAMDVMGRALQQFADTVQQHGGLVLRHTGDGLKAAFGTQGSREDDAERAVLAGLAILADADAHAQWLRSETGVAGFGVRVGIHTGPVLLGGGIEADRTAMGHAVHLAARMEQSAPVGRLRISEATQAQVRGLFHVEAQPPLRVKGHDQPLLTYLVQGPASDPERAARRGIEGLDTPMVGRDDELARLVALFERCVASGRPGIATVLADAGVGKTRLRRELLRRLGLEQGAGLLQARAHPSGDLQPYGLMRQLVARWFGIADDMAAPAARQRLVDGLLPWLDKPGPAAAHRLGQLIGLDFGDSPYVQGLGAPELREHAFAAMRQALRALARRAPLLLVLDDLHWADEASLDFVDTLVDDTPVPLMLVALARPALRERLPALATAGAAERVAIVLHPLPADQGQALAEALLRHLPEPPESLRRLLVERAEGNPFYMEELLRMLIDDGVVDAATRPWTVRAASLAALRVPDTLVGVLQARLDALPAGDLVALQQASIIGPVFWDAALSALEPQAPQALPALSRRALVVARADSAFAMTGEHAFHHQLLHDVTYGSVLKAARREGHARVARWLAERVADRAGEFLGITAEHFDHAGDSAQALEYYDRARQDAVRRGALRLALRFGDAALRQPALVAPRWRYHLLAVRHDTLDHLALADETRQELQDMADWAGRCDDDAMRADVSCARMLQADREGQPARARDLALQALAEAARSGAPAAAMPAALAHGELAWLAIQAKAWADVERHIAAGVEWARRAAELPLREGGYQGLEQQLRMVEIGALQAQERYRDAAEAIDRAEAAMVKHAPRDRYNLLEQRFHAQRQRGEWVAARRVAGEALALAERSEMRRQQAMAYVWQADIAGLVGEPESQAAALDAGEALARGVGYDLALAALQSRRGELAQQRGDLAAARAHFEGALRIEIALNNADAALQLHARLAALALQEGQPDPARQAAEAVLAQARADDGPGHPTLEPAALRACHQVMAATGDGRAQVLLDELRQRMQTQMAQCADAAARERLATTLPWCQTVRQADGERP